MFSKHKTGTTRDEKNEKLHTKVGRLYQANFNNIAQVMPVIYADYVSIIATTSSLTQNQKVLQNAVDNCIKKCKLNLNNRKKDYKYKTKITD